MSRKVEIAVAAGAKLLTQPTISLENVGDSNLSVIVNFRRQKEQLIRQEGWSKFRPIGAQPVNQQYIYDGAENLLRLAELHRANGAKVVVAASRTLIKYFDTVTATWIQIGSGFSAQGKRWQAVVINGVLTLNNTVDLPVYYKIGDAAVTPMYELRQVGVAYCGRITQYNGFLHLMDVTEIDSTQLNTWMNGYASYTVASTTNENANFNIAAPADNQKEFDVTTGAGTITATLPANPSLSTFPFYIWLKKVDNTAGTVVTSPLIADQKIVLSAQNDKALIWWNGTAWAAKYFAAGVIPANTPYGTPPADILNRFPDEVAWGTLGDATNWAPLFSAVQLATSATVYLPFVPSTWIAGQTRVAVINGGPAGGTLGGDSLHPDGILINSIGAFDPVHNGVPVVLEIATDAGLTYPRIVSMTRWGDTTAFVGKQLIGNGQTIVGGRDLQGQLIIYQTGEIWVSRYTAVATAPFAFRPKYRGMNTPLFGDCIASVNGDYHLFPAFGNRFYGFDGVSEPQVHVACDDARDAFFAGLDPTLEPFVMDNPLTKQLWFATPATVFAFDYEGGTVSTIDSPIAAAATVTKPGGTDTWFILAVANKVYTYGLVNSVGVTWLRDGGAAVPQWKSGLITFGTQQDEKTLLNYTPILSSPSPDLALSIDLLSTYNPSAAPVSLVGGGVALPDPASANFIPTMFQGTYFQDHGTVTDARDMDVRLSMRIFEIDLVRAGGVTRSGTT